MLNKETALEDVKLFVLDMDGTVYLGENPIPGAFDFIRLQFFEKTAEDGEVVLAHDFIPGVVDGVTGIFDRQTGNLIPANATAFSMEPKWRLTVNGEVIFVKGEVSFACAGAADGWMLVRDDSQEPVASGLGSTAAFTMPETPATVRWLNSVTVAAGGTRVVADSEYCANLEIGARYYWQVACRGYCGFGCGPKHGCKASKSLAKSPVATFTTEDLAPRWIAIEGRTANIRDLGGRHTADGRRVKQGLVFRGQGLNDNSVTGEAQGRNRLTAEDVKYFTRTLGIKTDLDLRSPGETADLAESPLGPTVRLVVRSSSCYRGIFDEHGKKVMAANFREFCDRKNYPIYFHCIGGADRTGSLGYVLNGVLGVDRHELETDWEQTFYPRIPDANPDPNFWCRESHFNAGFAKYGKEGDSWNRRIELYLLDCGITPEEIKTFREIMLEK